ncbi:MAG: ornithine cyclodeaminase family protein, partial [Chloroflexota bacterium]
MQRGGRATVKMVGYHPSNPERKNLPTILSTVSAYDTHSGRLLGLADATFLTALRTGAASAIASQAMAIDESCTIGLIGAGAQAMTQLHALSRCFDIKQVYVYDVNPAVCDSFFERVAFMGLNLTSITANNLDQLVRQADIICTTTSVDIGAGPVFHDGETKPHLHINAVGSDFPGKTEIPISLLKRSFVCPDFPEQAFKEGECQQLNQAEVGPSLVDLVQNPAAYSDVKHRLTIFDSTGWALEDQIAMEMLLDYAADLGLGTTMQIESSCLDPYNPYQFVRV